MTPERQLELVRKRHFTAAELEEVRAEGPLWLLEDVARRQGTTSEETQPAIPTPAATEALEWTPRPPVPEHVIRTFDRQATMNAVTRFREAPRTLSETDLQQLSGLESTMGERARAARAGYERASQPDDNLPFNLGVFLTWLDDYYFPSFLITRRIEQQDRLRIDDLTTRLDKACVTIDELRARCLELEATIAAQDVPADHVAAS